MLFTCDALCDALSSIGMRVSQYTIQILTRTVLPGHYRVVTPGPTASDGPPPPGLSAFTTLKAMRRQIPVGHREVRYIANRLTFILQILGPWSIHVWRSGVIPETGLLLHGGVLIGTRH